MITFFKMLQYYYYYCL